MDAVKYIKERNRHTNKTGSICNINCIDCILGKTNNGRDVTCQTFETRYTNEAVRLVEDWSRNHPQKTYLMDFLEKFPNCVKDKKGFPVSCRKFIYPLMSRENCSGLNCSDCWNEPMEDER